MHKESLKKFGTKYITFKGIFRAITNHYFLGGNNGKYTFVQISVFIFKFLLIETPNILWWCLCKNICQKYIWGSFLSINEPKKSNVIKYII